MDHPIDDDAGSSDEWDEDSSARSSCRSDGLDAAIIDAVVVGLDDDGGVPFELPADFGVPVEFAPDDDLGGIQGFMNKWNEWPFLILEDRLVVNDSFMEIVMKGSRKKKASCHFTRVSVWQCRHLCCKTIQSVGKHHKQGHKNGVGCLGCGIWTRLFC